MTAVARPHFNPKPKPTNPMHSLRILLILAAAAAAARAASPAIQLTEVTTNSGDRGPSKMEILLQGDRFSARTVDSSSQFPPPGTYIVGTGGGNMYFVNPNQRAYAKWDTSQIAQMAQQAAAPRHGRRRQMPGSNPAGNPADDGSGGDDYSRSLENFKFEKLVDEAGPRMFGYPTRHYKYHLYYENVTHIKSSPKPMVSKIDETDEFWSTRAFGDLVDILKRVGFKVPDAKGGDMTQVEDARRTMAHQGLMLKSITTRTDSQSLPIGGLAGALARMGRGGRPSTHTTMEEVTALAEVQPPRDAFALPRDFQETDMVSMFTAAGGGMPDLSGAAGGRTGRQPAMPDLNDQGN